MQSGATQPDATARPHVPNSTTMASLQLITIIVDDYDPAIEFFVEVLRFELVDDSLRDEDWTRYQRLMR